MHASVNQAPAGGRRMEFKLQASDVISDHPTIVKMK
jgi:hypothetical protein